MKSGTRFSGLFCCPQAKQVVIHSGTPVSVSTEQLFAPQARKADGHVGGTVPTATRQAGSGCQEVAEPEACPDQPLCLLTVAANRDKPLQGLNQLRRLPDPPGALRKRLTNQPQMAMLKLTQAAVQHPGGARDC